MLRAFAQHHVLPQRQLQRSLHSSFNASILPIRCEGLYGLVRNVHGSTTPTSREGGDSPGGTACRLIMSTQFLQH